MKGKKRVHNERGATIIEYSLFLALILAIGLPALFLFQGRLMWGFGRVVVAGGGSSTTMGPNWTTGMECDDLTQSCWYTRSRPEADDGMD